MTTEEMRSVLQEKGYVTASAKPSMWHRPCLAVMTYDPQPIVEDLIDYFNYCPVWEWKSISGKGYLIFSELQV